MEWTDEAFKEALNTPMHLIEMGLYLGNLYARESGHIDFVISVSNNEEEWRKLPAIPLTASEKRFFFSDTDIQKDSFSLDLVLDETDALIREKLDEGQNVLLHCAAGISRSATIVISYLISEYEMTTSEALEHVTAVRPQVNPRQTFLKVLIEREKRHEKKSCVLC